MKLPDGLRNPPNEYSVLPFWFWNDNLDEEEIITQIDDFEQHGVHGFVIHPRVGLPRDLGWMSDKLLDFYETALREAKRRSMKVLLYDEGMYPSGSSCGQVVGVNPDFQCRCLVIVAHTDNIPYQLKEDEKLISIVPDSSGCLSSVIDRKSKSFIRGVHYINDGPEEDAPPASDILNPAAVDCFIDLVYRKFVNRFSSYIGETVIGIFTDEPNMLGKCREQNIFPSTNNILQKITTFLGYDFTPHVHKLWSKNKAAAEKYRKIYYSACNQLLEKSYYSRLSAFCKENKIQLTGHPSGADDLGVLRYFDIPGQDLVWRRVVPDSPTALEEEESTQAKCSSSAMIHTSKRRNLNECCGAYGHELTWKEMLWLTNWAIIRGVNMIVPHAFFYSVRGCRKDERPPDVGPNATWWPEYKKYADAVKRLCWINTDSKHVCHVAILGKSNKLPWRAAKICFENQIDFNYLEERHLWEDAVISADGIQLAGMHYQVLIIEAEEDPKVQIAVKMLEADGRIIRYKQDTDENELIDFLQGKISAELNFTSTPSTPPLHENLRIRHVIKNHVHYYILFNEKNTGFEAVIKLPLIGPTFQFDPTTGSMETFDSTKKYYFRPHGMMIILKYSTA